jgi:DNA-binding transcriptional ArsR family regulator
MESEQKEELLWRILKTLEDISGKIDRLASILEFSQRRELESHIQEVIGKSEVRRDIYGLCDGTRNVREIARILGKSMPHISIQIAELEKAGIVKAKRIGKEKYYQKIL